MKTSVTLLCVFQVSVVATLIAISNMAAAQVEVAPGESVRGQFLSNHQEQEYSVNMMPGDRLRLHIRSVGDTLLTAFKIMDPGGNTIEGRSSGKRQHDITTPALSARGNYIINVRNKRGVGEYTISIGTTASDGTQILPGSRGP